MNEFCKKNPCDGCSFDVSGLGSEMCSAVIGDYCQATGEYIEETEEDREIFEKVQRYYGIGK